MTLYERIEKLRNQKGISQGNLEKELGFSNGSISKWKTSTPKPERLQVLADHFGVSIDFLMGKTDMVVCPVCGFGNNPLSEQSRKEHELFHQRFLKIKEKYPFFKPYSIADKERTDSIFEFRSYRNNLEQKMAAFEKYLQSSFSIEINRNDYIIDNLDYKEFCKTEVSALHEDDCISQELIDALIDKYGIDRNFLAGNEYLLARISKNPQLIRLLAYAEKLNPGMLNMLEVQAKALSEHNAKDQE